jgi:hypothetical protein
MKVENPIQQVSDQQDKYDSMRDKYKEPASLLQQLMTSLSLSFKTAVHMASSPHLHNS